jgi:hypothetical protein
VNPRIATVVTASILNDSSNGGFNITSLASFAEMPAPPDVPPPLRGGNVIDVDQQTDGAPLAVSAEDLYIEIDVSFGSATFGSYNA